MPLNSQNATSSMAERPANERPVIVCGAGAAGIAAALAAARSGANVWLIERNNLVGGTVTHALIHTLGGFFDSHGELLNRGLPEEIVLALSHADPSVRKRKMGRTWVLCAAPELYRSVVEGMLAAEPRIRVLTGSWLTEVECRDGRIGCVEGITRQEKFRVSPRAAIDTTGAGALVRQIDPRLIEDDPRRAAGGLVVRLRGVAPAAVAFPGGLSVVRSLREAAADGTIPATCRHAWVDQGIADDEVYVKLFVPAPSRNGDESVAELTATTDYGEASIFDFLKRMPGFENARLHDIGTLGIRDGGRVRGEYQLTGDDIRRARRFDDAACRGAWPIEYWDPEHGLSLEYLPSDSIYDIPLRSLKVRGLENVWVAGKCLSADREAQASARVVGTCWAMGEAAGKAAVQ
jgi:hypothetical protein